MPWADKKIQQYKEGKEASWIEKRMLEHAEPLHFILAIIGALILFYGAWLNDWNYVIFGAVLNLIGHIYTWIRK